MKRTKRLENRLVWVLNYTKSFLYTLPETMKRQSCIASINHEIALSTGKMMRRLTKEEIADIAKGELSKEEYRKKHKLKSFAPIVRIWNKNGKPRRKYLLRQRIKKLEEKLSLI